MLILFFFFEGESHEHTGNTSGANEEKRSAPGTGPDAKIKHQNLNGGSENEAGTEMSSNPTLQGAALHS